VSMGSARRKGPQAVQAGDHAAGLRAVGRLCGYAGISSAGWSPNSLIMSVA
jgi:hypothetical protein